MFRIQVVDSFDKFMSLAPSWDGLLARSDMDIVYMTHSWFGMYWKLFEKNSRMQILVFTQDGEPAAIVPFMMIKAFWRGIRHTCLTFIANFFSCRTGIINPSGGNVFDLALAHLKESRTNFDMAYLNFIPEGSSTDLAVRQAAAERRLLHRVMPGDSSPYIPLEGLSTWDDYLKSKNKHFRDNLKRAVKAFENNGDYELRTYRSPEELPAAWEKVLCVSRNTWKYRNGTAIASTALNRHFFRAFAAMAAEKGWLKILMLEHKGKPIAFTLELPYKKTLFFNKTGFDESQARLSPGTYILCRSLRDAIEGGFREFDLLGKNEEYKMRFTPIVRRHYKFFLFNDSATGRLLARYELTLLPLMKNMLNRIRRRGQAEAETDRQEAVSAVKTGRDVFTLTDSSSPSRLKACLKPFRDFVRGISGHIHR